MKKEYDSLAKKYSLPSFEALEKEFFIGENEDEPVLIHVRKQMIEKMSSFASFLEGLMHPDTSLPAMYESSVFDEEDNHLILKLYKTLLYLERLSLETALDNSDKQNVLFISEAYETWVSIKKDILQIVVKAKQFWKSTPKKGEHFFN